VAAKISAIAGRNHQKKHHQMNGWRIGGGGESEGVS